MAVGDTPLDPRADSTKPARRDAVGVEIPVTVHASRTTQGLGKNLPPVHEDTKTVIVLQQGAVVRLTSSLSTGETVVLTNRMTGADVLCRVGNVKSQAGTQHYVDLEFIQRAPGFWGDTVPASTVPPATPTSASAPGPAAPVTPLAAPVVPVPPLVAAPAPPPPAAAFTAPPQPQPPQIINVAPPPVRVMPPPPAPVPIVDLPPVAAAETLQPALLAEPVAAAWMTPQSSSATPARGNMDQSSFGSISATNSVSATSSSSTKILMGVAAAVVLVLGGAGGGYWFYSHQAGAAGSRTSQQTANIPAVPSVVPSASPVTSAGVPAPEPLPPAVNAPAPEARMDVVLESRPQPDEPTARAQTPPAAVKRAPAVKRSVTVEQMSAPKAKTATARMDSSAAPPVIPTALNLGEVAPSSLLVAEPVAPAPPPVNSGRVSGGQLEPPQMISSTPPVYPPAAKMSRIQGVVLLDALINETGKVVETTVINGPPQLASAAQQSVQGWKYKPAQLNGKPVPVHERVSVRFTLQ